MDHAEKEHEEEMTKLTKPDSTQLSRREAIGRVAAGLGLLSTLTRDDASAAQRAAPPPSRRTVQTLRGPIDTAKLGFTLSHEHICASSAGMWQAWPQLFGGRAQFIRTAVDQLKQAKDEGVDSFVDVTTFDLGRDIRLMEEIAGKSEIQVIAATGHWLDESNSMSARTVEELTDFFLREINEGIEGTDIKAGVIKVASGNTLTPFSEKVLRAAARASKASGVPLTTHSPAAVRMGEKHAEIFESEGVAPSRVCIGHSDNSEADYQMALARRGYYLGMDQLPRGGPATAGTPGAAPGQPTPKTFDERLAGIKALVDAGFGGRVMLSNDHSLAMSLQPTAADRLRLAQSPDGILFVSRKVVPGLKAIGLSEQAIRTLSVDAPRRFFEGG
jgi:phosphotriesterase-related protein